MKTSWKTTTLGIIGGLTILFAQIKTALDDDPATQPNIEAIVGALALMGIGAVARDNDVTSEDVGAK